MDEQSTVFESRNSKEILKDKLASKISGITLGEFFEISDKAQEGGMGDVYFCRDKRDNKFYVLKSAPIDKDINEIFKKECLFVLSLWKNPYIVYSKTLVADSGKLYIVMDFIGKQPYNLEEQVQGETLTRVISKSKIEPKQAIIWAIQFCKGMQFLNTHKMLTHKDIKPDNILITPSNDIKITDFGLASIEKKGGTIGYRPPEYFSKEQKLTIQSDIYSFGLVFYQMLNNGELLSSKTVLNKDTKEYEFVDEDKLGSNHCQDIIKKCLQKKPSKRYKNFEELEEELIKYLHNKWPEYTMPILKAESMSANDYFLKGLGYYILEDKLKAFLLFSLAIFEDPKFAEAYYYRSKITVFPKIVHIFLTLLPILILAIFSLWSYKFVMGDFRSLIWILISEYFVVFAIGLIWLLYVMFKELGWKTVKGTIFLIKNYFMIVFNRDIKKAQKLKPNLLKNN